MYLRKSRADLEAEARGEGETLSKHRRALLKVAKQQNLTIVNERQEIVSGESIVHRPQMLQLLKEVEDGLYDAVLCMDLDRLGRGKMQEQGLILETFQKSKTKIITPRKVYDLSDEWDEEYSEFEAFMARKELKIITRRLQGGRLRSIEDGNYIATRPPYGYDIKKNGKERYLVPNQEQAPVVKMIFEWYTHPTDRLGSNKIAKRLNELGYKTYTGKKWSGHSVMNILKNAVYTGRIQWKKKQQTKSLDPGKKRDTKTRPKEEWIDVKGKHEPLISTETFQKAASILKQKYHVPYQLENGITNPLAGLVKCGHCDASMVYRPYTKQKPHLVCYNSSCNCKSSRFEFVENKLLQTIKVWLEAYIAQWETTKPKEDEQSKVIPFKEASLRALEKELVELEKQRANQFDLLERKIYDEATFMERSKAIGERIEQTTKTIAKIKKELNLDQVQKKTKKDFIPKVKHVLDLYDKTEEPKMKNNLLKSVLEKAVYKKSKEQTGEDFDLEVHLRVRNENR